MTIGSLTIEPALLGFAVVIFLSYAVQTVAGFGSMLICLTLGAHLLEIRDLMTLAVPISIVQTTYIVVRHRKNVDRPLLYRVLPLMGGATALSLWLSAGFTGSWLRTAFGVMILGLALRELWLMRPANAGVDRPPPSRLASSVAIAGAGLIHGVYATGGPLLVYAVGREKLDKHQFRATLSAVWLVLGVVLLGTFVFLQERYDEQTSLELLVLLPAVPLGILVGEWMHAHVDERRFKTGVWVLLVAAAVSLLLR